LCVAARRVTIAAFTPKLVVLSIGQYRVMIQDFPFDKRSDLQIRRFDATPIFSGKDLK
jgi:hypothetical protein